MDRTKIQKKNAFSMEMDQYELPQIEAVTLYV